MSKQIFTFSVLISLFFGCGVISTVIARAEDEIIISESLDTESGSSDPDETTGQEEFFATSTDDHIPEDIAVASTTISNSDDNASTTLQSAKETFLDATTTEEDRMADDLNVDVDLVEEITDTTAFESETQITEPGIPTWEIISPSINESVNGRVTVKIRANPNGSSVANVLFYLSDNNGTFLGESSDSDEDGLYSVDWDTAETDFSPYGPHYLYGTILGADGQSFNIDWLPISIN